jgi:hypothetical protein
MRCIPLCNRKTFTTASLRFSKDSGHWHNLPLGKTSKGNQLASAAVGEAGVGHDGMGGAEGGHISWHG